MGMRSRRPLIMTFESYGLNAAPNETVKNLTNSSLEAVFHVHVLATRAGALPHLQAVEDLPDVVAAALGEQLGGVGLEAQALGRGHVADPLGDLCLGRSPQPKRVQGGG